MAVVRSEERIDEGLLRWIRHVERRENNKIPKRFHAGE